MHDFVAHRLRVVAEVRTPMVLETGVGSALRGALYHALTDGFCANQPVLTQGGCPVCPLIQTCPVGFLAATLDPAADRGENVPRPFTIEPPAAAAATLQPPARLEFGLTMFAQALNLFPYVVLSLERMGQRGIGAKLAENNWRRGTFAVREVWAENPLTGQCQAVLQAGERVVHMPDVPVTHEQACALPPPPPGAQVWVDFVTPTRLLDHGQPVRQPDFRVLFQRLMERLEALSRAFSETPLDGQVKYELVGRARAVRLVADRTRWLRLEGFSGRQGERKSLSGIVGYAVYEADDWAAFWPWLKWGELTHVGKNAVKGDGVIRVLSAEC